jgi:hypothetical protein
MTDHRKTYAYPSSNMVFDEIKEEFINEYTPGMDLRDYFAAKAMQAMMTAGFWNWNKPSEDADRCYAQADEMMKARKV